MGGYQDTDAPLVSVIIPAYNAERFIARTLESVLNQTYKNIEVLVVDDGSSDRTPEIVHHFAEIDSRITLFQQSNAGVAAARNLAIQHAKGAFIAPLDADDIWYPTNLEKQVQCLAQSDASVGLVYSWSIDIDEADQPVDGFHAARIEGNVFTTLLCHNFIANASATLIRRSCLEKVGGYNCQLRELDAQGCEDWDLYLRIAEAYQFRAVPEFLVGYRKVLSSMSRNYATMARSHALMLQFARKRRPETSEAACRLSASSFYLYLARQSRQQNCYRGTLFWLAKALQSDCVTPAFRYGLYSLLLESFIRLTIKPISALIGKDNYYWVKVKQSFKSVLLWLTTFKSSNPQAGIKLKLLVGQMMHHSIPVVFGNHKV
jgi:glycosyltransferase involved in cell wall biosynthesis